MAKKNANPFTMEDGRRTWISHEKDKYAVTGVDRNGKRFSYLYDNWGYACGINLWQGSRWLVRDGKRYLISRVYN